MAAGAEGGENLAMEGSPSERRDARRWRAVLGLALACSLHPAEGLAAPDATAPAANLDAAQAQEPDAPQAPVPTAPPGKEPGADEEVPVDQARPIEAEAAATEPAWIDERHAEVEHRLGKLVDAFDRFFGDERQLDVESPRTRLRLKSYVRTAQDRDFAWAAAAAVSVRLPRLQRWLRNARLVLTSEDAGVGVPVAPSVDGPPGETTPPVVPPPRTAESIPGTRGRADLRFDLLRRENLILDTGVGVSFAWPAVPYARLRGHLRHGLGAGFMLRATQNLFVEAWGRGPGTTTDLVLDRFFGTALRLRWEGHGLFARTTRGVEWSTLVAAEWKVHRRTGLGAGVSAAGFGTPEPGLDVWRTWVSVRQDLWSGWIFAELEPEVAWPRPAGMPRDQVLAVTLRLEVVIDAHPDAEGKAR